MMRKKQEAQIRKMEKKLRKYGRLLEGWKKGQFSSDVEDVAATQVCGMDLSRLVQNKENLQEADMTETEMTSREPDSSDSESLAHDTSYGDNQSGEENNPSKSVEQGSSSLLQNSQIPDDPALDAELLKKLGQDDKDLRKEVKIHTQVAAIWSKILNEGLKREAKTELLDKYPRQGCLQLEAPLLNPEVETVVNDTVKKRDRFVALDQSLCGATMAALGSLISDIIEKGSALDWMEVVQNLSDAGRLQCELMYQLSKARRALIYPGFKKEARLLLEKTKPDEFLFGTGLADRLKSAKLAEKAGLSMKFASFPTRGPLRTSTAGNWKGPSAKQYYQQAGHRQRFQRSQGRNRPFGNKSPRGPMRVPLRPLSAQAPLERK